MSCSLGRITFLTARPLWQNYVVGYFIGDAPPHIAKIHATVNRIWASTPDSTRIDVQTLNSTSVLFKIADDAVRARVLKRKFWHVAEIPLIVNEWTPESSNLSPDLSSVPLWVDFASVPRHLFSYKGLSFLGSLIGNPIRIHPNTERCMRFDVARVMVEVNLLKPLPTHVQLPSQSEDPTLISVAFPWLPSRCTVCNNWGHTAKKCESVKNIMQHPKEQSSLKQSETERKIVIDTEKKIVTEATPKSPQAPMDKISPETMSITAPIVERIQTNTEVEWTMVSTSNRNKHNASRGEASNSSPTRKVSSPKTSPGFHILADIREEGEIEENEAEDETVEANETVDTQELDSTNDHLLQINSISNKGRTKVNRRPLLHKKDIILSKTTAASKKASSRKL